jgi:voltage-dependent potassium channel beta subunit
VEYRRVGKSGLKISAISLGTWQTFGDRLDRTTAAQILRTAVDGGVNFLDLADGYARGAAEQIVGELLGDYRRSQFVLSSKLFWPMSDDPNDRGLSRKHIVESIERTLQNLRTDYLDIYFCHRADPETPLDETMRAMDDLVHQGKILYWGTSMWQPRALKQTYKLANSHHLYAPIVEQPPYNLLERWIEKRVLPTARRLGMGLVVWSPLAGGVLTGKYSDGIPEDSRGASKDGNVRRHLNEQSLQRVRRLSILAEGLGVAPGQLALAWLLQHEEITSVVTGATRSAQMESNLAAILIKIPNEINREICRIFRP